MRTLLIGVLISLPLAAWAGKAEKHVEQWLAGKQTEETGLTLDVAPWVEDGAFVSIDLTLIGAVPPVSIRLLRSEEDDPRIANIEVQRWAEPLRLSTRVRLPQTQAVIVLAQDGRGRVWRTQQTVEVLASSCMTPMPASRPANFGQIQAWADGEQELEVRTLLRHPMETGRRPDQAGGVLPRHLPALLKIQGEEGGLLRVEPFEGLSVNPYWRVLLPLNNRALSIQWIDADGRQFNAELPMN
jgi:predicted secreted protein